MDSRFEDLARCYPSIFCDGCQVGAHIACQFVPTAGGLSPEELQREKTVFAKAAKIGAQTVARALEEGELNDRKFLFYEAVGLMLQALLSDPQLASRFLTLHDEIKNQQGGVNTAYGTGEPPRQAQARPEPGGSRTWSPNHGRVHYTPLTGDISWGEAATQGSHEPIRPSQRSPPPPQLSQLPAGWTRAWCYTNRQEFYVSSLGGTQWEYPLVALQTPTAAITEDRSQDGASRD